MSRGGAGEGVGTFKRNNKHTDILKKMAERDDEIDQGRDTGLAVKEAAPKLKQPPLYRVILFNDDYTPMEFVVEILEMFFMMDRSKATQIMLHVHTRGKGVCGVFSRDVAETKVDQVNHYSRQHQHPLLCDMEPAD